MPLKAKHIVEELNGERCTVVEKGIDASRADFLKKLLEFNGFTVVIADDKKETEDATTLYTLGVTDLVFNPVIAVYEMSLKTQHGQRVSPAYWEQQTTDSRNEYWITE